MSEPEPGYRAKPPRDLSPAQQSWRAKKGAAEAGRRQIIKENFTPGCRIAFAPDNPATTIRTGRGTFRELRLVDDRHWRVFYTLDDYRPNSILDCATATFLADRPSPISE